MASLTKLKADCNCTPTVTGGSEIWMHTTHGPNNSKIDLKDESNLLIYVNTHLFI